MEPPKIVERVKDLEGREHVVLGGCLPPEPTGFMEKTMSKRPRRSSATGATGPRSATGRMRSPLS
jgi:hypothetical protein